VSQVAALESHNSDLIRLDSVRELLGLLDQGIECGGVTDRVRKAAGIG
jgi:hypothetical protein